MSDHPTPLTLTGHSVSIQKVKNLIQKVAGTDSIVLISGGSGTGKEVAAKMIHAQSPRADKPFIAINCAAIPRDLFESELFGHEKGAFTGAIAQQPGRFELAQGGTLFLDEIGDLPLEMQAKLLRVIQEQSFERVGGKKPIRMNVRIIAATNKPLKEAIQAGLFREDLYYRLNIFPIHMPDLSERVEDIPLIVEDYCAQHIRFEQFKCHSDVVTYWQKQSWPGNIRELLHVLDRLVILYPNKEVTLEDLPDKSEKGDDSRMEAFRWKVLEAQVPDLKDPIDLKQTLLTIEANLIQRALDESKGVVALAAKRLGLRRTTLIEKMKRYRIGKKNSAI